MEEQPDITTVLTVGDDAGPVVRRAPFSDNPQVGERGQRTRQRILDATHRVLGDEGFHRCSIESITRQAGCSRATFYQYFESKDDVFTRLAMQVTRRLEHATATLDAVTPDGAGWQALRDWGARFAATYDSQRPVFHNFATASQADPHLARRLAREGRRYHAVVLDRLRATDLDATVLAAVVDIMASTIFRSLDDAWILEHSALDHHTVDEVLDAYTDVYHRTLFGVIDGVNVRPGRELRSPGRLRLPRVREGSAVLSGGGDDRTRARLLDAGRTVFGRAGYHGASIDSIVTEAGVSHGSFYSYFPSKEHLAQQLALAAGWDLSDALAEIEAVPGPADATDSLRAWLGRYTSAQAESAAVLRAWFDAALVDERLLVDSGPMVEVGRRRLARFLSRRGFSGTGVDAVVLLALFDGLGVAQRSTRTLGAGTAIIERGFLGR